LGILGLALVVICGVILSVAMFRIGALVGQVVTNGNIDPTNQAELQQAVMAQMGGGAVWGMLINGCTLAGFVGWVLGIVATATKRGRAFGIFAIVLGVLAPVIAIVMVVVALLPYLPSS
jgi:hypothetical protein